MREQLILAECYFKLKYVVLDVWVFYILFQDHAEYSKHGNIVTIPFFLLGKYRFLKKHWGE